MRTNAQTRFKADTFVLHVVEKTFKSFQQMTLKRDKRTHLRIDLDGFFFSVMNETS